MMMTTRCEGVWCVVAGGCAAIISAALLASQLRFSYRRRQSLKYLRNPLDYEQHALEFGNPIGIAYYGFFATPLKETYNSCRRYFESIRFIPRSMKGVDSKCNVTYFGKNVAAPLIVAPTALHQFADPQGEVATATGAGKANCVYCFNYFLSTKSLEEVAKIPGEKWLHLYLFKERNLVEFAVEECLEKYKGVFSAVIVTLDHPHDRVRDRVLPYFRKYWYRNNLFSPYMPNLARAAGFAHAPRVLDVLYRNVDVGGTNDFSLTWEDLTWLSKIIRGRLPLVGKGVLHPQDALAAVQAGCSAVVVSNHGGRQHDLGVSAIEMLSQVVSEVKTKHPEVLVFCDSGVRTSGDVVRILALGGDGALIGRPPLFALMCGGSKALEEMLDQWRRDIEDDMKCLGWERVKDMPQDLVIMNDNNR